MRTITKSVRNFTGRIVRNPDGTVVIIGTGPKPKGAKALNPLSAKGGRFAKCVKAVERKGGAYDPRAVCGAMEKRRKTNGKLRRPRNGKESPRVRKALTKYVRSQKNPGVRTFDVHIPATRYDKGYKLTIKAKTKAAARAEAKRYCAAQFAKYSGHPASQYKLPAKTKVVEV